MRVGATHYFSVRGLFVVREVLGARYDVTYDGAAFELELPSPKNVNGPGDPRIGLATLSALRRPALSGIRTSSLASAS